MIETKVRDAGLEALCSKAITAAKTRGQKQLLSITRKMKTTNLLHIYDAFQPYVTERVFWMDHDRTSAFAALGCAVEIGSTENRFEETKTLWQRLIREAWIDNPFSVPGTGLTAFGGFSFDPEKPATHLWRHFPDSRFIVPAYLVAKHNDAFFITMNAEVLPETNVKQIQKSWQRFMHILEQTSEMETKQPDIARTEEIAPEDWKACVQKAKTAIQQKQADKIVLARELRVQLKEKVHAAPILEKLMQAQANSYIFAFERAGDCFVGATPERLVKVEQDAVFSACVAGTAPRGKDRLHDEMLANELLQDQKNRQEHQFVVNMIDDALQHHCDAVRIPEEPIVYPLKNLWHLYTPVQATLKKGGHILDIVEELHPTPALGGTPREASVTFIRQNEILDRGWYGAPVGWMDASGNGEFAVAIRSALLQGDAMSLFAGCGVVADSDPEKEYAETKIKFMPMLSVLEAEK